MQITNCGGGGGGCAVRWRLSYRASAQKRSGTGSPRIGCEAAATSAASTPAALWAFGRGRPSRCGCRASVADTPD